MIGLLSRVQGLQKKYRLHTNTTYKPHTNTANPELLGKSHNPSVVCVGREPRHGNTAHPVNVIRPFDGTISTAGVGPPLNDVRHGQHKPSRCGEFCQNSTVALSSL